MKAGSDGEPRGTSRALLAGLVGLLGLRVLAALLPGRELWGLDLGRDLPRLDWVLPLVVCLAACVPFVGRALARVVPGRGPGMFLLVAASALALAGFALEHPDRARYTGDTRWRHGEFAELEHPETIAPQATRGDLLLHHALPRWVAARTGWSTEDAGRALGALLAALTALAGWGIAAAAGADGGVPGSGIVALAAAAAATGTAALALDNGYAKATTELCVLTTLMGAGVVRLAGEGRGLGTLGVSLALGLLLHRSALALVPVWVVGSAVALRAGRGREPGALLGLAAPLAALGVEGPRLWQVAATFDREHHFATAPGGSLVSAWLAPAHLVDAGNTLALIAPLAPLLPLLFLLWPRLGGRAAVLAAAFALPPIALLLVVVPQQGLPRDWDVFAFAGSALSALAAWRVARVLGAAPRARWLAGAVALATIVPALQLAALQSDDDRMWARAESIWIGPPVRAPEERAQGLAAIGLMRHARGEYDDARRLLALSYSIAPHARRLVEWGIAAGLAGHHAEACRYYRRAAELRPDLATAWKGLAESGAALADSAQVRDAVAHLERLDPGNPTLAPARRWLGLQGSH